MGRAARTKRERSRGRNAGDGNCYESAVDIMNALPPEGRRWARLVHGTVIGNAPPVLDRPFSHAWVEIGGAVFDNSHGNETVTRREVYYERARIDPATVTLYDYETMLLMLARRKHYGPWA